MRSANRGRAKWRSATRRACISGSRRILASRTRRCPTRPRQSSALFHRLSRSASGLNQTAGCASRPHLALPICLPCACGQIRGARRPVSRGPAPVSASAGPSWSSRLTHRRVEGAAAEQRVLADDKARRGATEEGAGVAELGRVADAAGRGPLAGLRQLLLERYVLLTRLELDPRAQSVGEERAGQNAVDRHVVFGHLTRQSRAER